MPRFDLTAEELHAYRPDVAEPSDFDDFWDSTLGESRALATPPLLRRISSALRAVEVYDITTSGFGGDPVRGWLLLPAGGTEVVPLIAEFQGYGGGRGLPHERLAWAASGYAWYIMDTRGQGTSLGGDGSTADPHGSGPAAPGFMTRGIRDPHTYYYRRVHTDAVLAIEALRSLPRIDGDRVTVAGASQGGGIAIAAAGLAGNLFAALPEAPFLCHFERAVGMTGSEPYQEIVRYLAVHRGAVDEVFLTLSYFDGVNFAKRATAPALFSAGHMDPICPPSTVYAAANHWAAGAEVVDYPFNEHEAGWGPHWIRQSTWMSSLAEG